MNKEDCVRMFKSWGDFVRITSRLNDDILEIRRLIGYNRQLKAMSYNEMSSSDISKPTENIAIKNIEVYEAEIKDLEMRIRNIKQNKEFVDGFLLTLDTFDRRLISLRYLRKKGWDNISMNVYMSVRQCYRVHNKIIKALGEYTDKHSGAETGL